MSCYLSAADILQVFEGTESCVPDGDLPVLDGGLSGAPVRRHGQRGHRRGVGADVTDAAKDGIGNIYVDDEAEPPNYSTLPAFWSAEVSDAAGGQASQPVSGTLRPATGRA